MKIDTSTPSTPSTPLRPDRVGNVTLKQVRWFLVASQCQTFTQAAERVFLSQAAFCRAIQELESALGEELFTRSNHGIKLSESGEAFLPYAQRLMAYYDETLTSMTKRRSVQQGNFVLAGSQVVMHAMLPTLLRRLSTDFEHTSLQFDNGTSQQVVASVMDGRADCGICTLLADQPELRCINLLQAPIGLLVSPDFALPDSITCLDDLKGINLARYGAESVITQLLQTHAPGFEAYHASRVVCSDLFAAYGMVQDGQIAAVASAIGASHSEASGLQFVPLPGLLPMLSISQISKRDIPFDAGQELLKKLTRVCVLATPWHPSVVRVADSFGTAASEQTQ